LTETIDAPLVLEPATSSTQASYNFINNSTNATNVLSIAGNVSGGTTTYTSSANGATLTINGVNTGNNTISGVISNGTITGSGGTNLGLGVNKSGAGTWILSGNNTYTGATIMNNASGTLIVSGANTGTSGVTVGVNDTFILDASSNANASLPATANVIMQNGSVFNLKANSAGTTQTLANLTMNGGTGYIDSLVFTDASMAAGGTINFTGTISNTNSPATLNVTKGANDVLEGSNLSTGFSSTNNANAGLLPLIVLNGTDLAGYTQVGSELVVGTAAYTNLTGSNPTYTSGNTYTIEISNSSTGTVTLGSGTTLSNSLVMKDTSARSIDLAGGILAFSTVTTRYGTILSSAGAGPLTIMDSVGTGAVTTVASASHFGSVNLINDSSSIDTFSAIISDYDGTTDEGNIVTVLGTGTWVLSGANTYTGGTFLNGGGTLDINSATALGGAPETVSTGQHSSIFTIYTGNIDNTSGAPITLTNNNPLVISGNFGFNGTNALNMGTGAVGLGVSPTITVSANTLTLGGVIASTTGTTTTNGLTKAGAGTLVLNGNNLFTGATTINGGTLAINGTNTTPITINSGATLTGTGSTTGALTLANGGNITPGAAGTSTGTLTAASLTFNPGASLTYTLNNTSTATGLLSLTVAFTKGSTGTGSGFNIDLTGGVVGDQYQLVGYGTSTFSVANFTAVGDTGTFSLGSGALDFTVLSVVPEPKTVALMGLFLLAFLCSSQGRGLFRRFRRG
jgi:autotransporter-associated beta strand protein